MEMFNFNLRGTEVYPEPRPDVHYFLCVIDAPADVSQTDFRIETDTDNDIHYHYNGDFSSWGDATQTVCLPLHTSKPIDRMVDFIYVTDNAGNQCSGTPNSGKPPIVKLQTDPGSDYLAVSQVFQSATPGFENDCFIVALVSTAQTNPPGGYANAFSGSQPNLTDDGSVIQFQMVPKQGNKSVAIGGVAPSALNYYQYTQAVDGSGVPHASLVIIWASKYPI